MILIPLVILVANYVYVFSGFYEKDIRTCDGELIYRIDSLASTSAIVYFAESSNFTAASTDSSKESISEIANRLYGKNEIRAINHAASHAGNYKVLINRLKGASTRTIIISMNLRSFGINWIESKLETNLSRSNIIYSNYPPIIKKFCLAFRAYDNQAIFQRERTIYSHYRNDVIFEEEGKYRTVKKWDAFMFSKGHLKANGERDPEKCNLACHFIKNYAFVIKDDNPRVKDFDAIIDFCNENNIKVVLNLLPENVELARQLCGEDLITLMEKNRQFLKTRYSDRSIFVDNMSLLPDSTFTDRYWPTEHYNYQGRKQIALNITSKLR